MKFKNIAIVVLFSNLHVLCACGNSLSDNDTTEVNVTCDSNFFLKDLFPNKKIYGDPNLGGNDDSLFNVNQVNPNKSIRGVEISRIDGKVCLSIKYGDLIDSVTDVEIRSAENKDRLGYCPAEKLVIHVKKEVGDSVSSGIKDTAIQKLKQDIERLQERVDYINDDSCDVVHLLMSFLIPMFMGIVIGLLLFVQNKKKLRDFSMEISDLRNLIDKREGKNVRVSLPQVEQQKKKETCSMTDDDIKKFVVEQIKSLQTQFTPAIFQQTMISSQVECETNHANKQCPAIDTDDVKYHQDGNFFILEHTENKIFRIYSRSGEYYYTVVDDSDVRKELASMLQVFTDCMSIQTTVKEANRIEPVTDGKLIKESDRFRVDCKNKLVVKYV